MKNTAEAKLDSVPAANFAEGIRMAHRRRMLEAFIDFMGKGDADCVLDVSSAAVGSVTAAGHLFQEYASAQGKTTVSTCEVFPAMNGQSWNIAYPHNQSISTMECRRFPFADQAFDWVYCNGVIETAGNVEEQSAFLGELWRMARKGVFLTTSNKKHFIEFNTGMPLLHWLPGSLWHHSLNLTGKKGWADQHMLNLLDASMIEKMAQQLPGSPKAEIGHVRFAVMKAHFFVMIRK